MNIFQNRYKKLINHYKNVIVDGFIEIHHIVPVCMGGTNDKENLVQLPAKAHYIAHYLLHKAYPDNKKLAHAFAMMAVNNPSQNRRSCGFLYEQSKMARSSALKGVPRPEWVKEKMRKPKTNKENYKGPTKEAAEKISKALKGRKFSEEHKQNMRKSIKKSKQKIMKETEKRRQYYRQKFLELQISRKEFYNLHPEKSASTLKNYLRGL